MNVVPNQAGNLRPGDRVSWNENDPATELLQLRAKHGHGPFSVLAIEASNPDQGYYSPTMTGGSKANGRDPLICLDLPGAPDWFARSLLVRVTVQTA